MNPRKMENFIVALTEHTETAFHKLKHSTNQPWMIH